MPHTVWTGDIQFGLVTVGVKLHASADSKSVELHQYQIGTTDRIRQHKVNESTGQAVEPWDIVMGFEDEAGPIVTFNDSELNELKPDASRSINVQAFVELSEVDPIYFEKTYYLAPAKPEASKGYALLTAVLANTGRAGIVTFVMRRKEHLALLRARNGRLVLDTMHWPEAVRSTADIPVPTPAESDDPMYVGARMMIESGTVEWNPAEFRDPYAARLHNLVADKRAAIPQLEEIDQESEFEAVILEMSA